MARHTIPDIIERADPRPGSLQGPGRSTTVNLIKSLRPSQWTKNLSVFLPLLFGERLTDPQSIAYSIAGFAVFCILSGVVYLINDVADREADRQHPVKMRRPIASGAVSPAAAVATAITLATLALGGAFWLRPAFGILAASY